MVAARPAGRFAERVHLAVSPPVQDVRGNSWASTKTRMASSTAATYGRNAGGVGRTGTPIECPNVT